MAKQVGEYRFVGTTEDGLCFYKMEGEYYVRRKSCLTGKMFRTRKCFEGSRRSCVRLARGSQIAATVYADFEKQTGMYKQLKSRAIALLKEGLPEEEVQHSLYLFALEFQPPKQQGLRKARIINYSIKNKPAPVFKLLPFPTHRYLFRRFRSTA